MEENLIFMIDAGRAYFNQKCQIHVFDSTIGDPYENNADYTVCIIFIRILNFWFESTYVDSGTSTVWIIFIRAQIHWNKLQYAVLYMY